MPVEEAPDDDAVHPSYNFAPGYHGLVYRAEHQPNQEGATSDTKYRLQAMQWGVYAFRVFDIAVSTETIQQAWYPSGPSATPTMAPR